MPIMPESEIDSSIF